VPSLVPETFGLASVEAQAMGCPVIVADLGALPETIVAAEQDAKAFTGWLARPGDVEALAKTIGLALGLNPEERAKIGTRASIHARNTFKLADMQRATLAVYDDLLGSNLAARFDAPV
jgi:glycosyltransferase involved in cell wall biosynthesis